MNSLPLLVFDLHDARFAVDARQVRESIWLPELTPAEEAPAWLAGLFSLRGRIVPVSDLQIRLGHPRRPHNPSDQVVVLEAERLAMGLIVSEVIGVIEFPADTIQPPPQFDLANPGQSHLVTGEVRVDGDAPIVLHIRQRRPARPTSRWRARPPTAGRRSICCRRSIPTSSAPICACR